MSYKALYQLIDRLKETADGYRIEADCAMRDFDRLEVAASEALEILSVKNRYPDWHRAAEILRSELERDSTEGEPKWHFGESPFPLSTEGEQ